MQTSPSRLHESNVTKRTTKCKRFVNNNSEIFRGVYRLTMLGFWGADTPTHPLLREKGGAQTCTKCCSPDTHFLNLYPPPPFNLYHGVIQLFSSKHPPSRGPKKYSCVPLYFSVTFAPFPLTHGAYDYCYAY